MTERYMQVGDTDFSEIFPKHHAKDKNFRSYWSSPEKFAAGLANIKDQNHWHNSGWDRDTSGWHGTKTFDEAVDLVHTGWKEGATKASRLLDRIMAKHPLQKRPKQFGIAGAFPDVPRAIAGNPFNMHVLDPERASRRPVITLLSDIGANCSHDNAEFINRAAVVAAIVDQIEAAGYACDVITFCTSYNGAIRRGEQGNGFVYIGTCKVKDCNQPVDIARLAFGLGHTGMFRRLIFAEMGGHDFNESLGGGLGCSYSFKEEEVKELNSRSIYIIPSVERSDKAFKTEEDAETKGLDFLLKGLQSQNFPMFRNGGSFVLDGGPMNFVHDNTVIKQAA